MGPEPNARLFYEPLSQYTVTADEAIMAMADG